MAPRRLRPLLLGLTAAAVLALGVAWLRRGGSDPVERAGGADARGSVAGTVGAALAALGRLDRAALVELLTPVGRVALEKDLALFGLGLADPARGPRLLAKVRERWPEVPEALIEGARGGRLDDVWTLFLRVTTPPGVLPEQAGMRIDPAAPDRAEVLYRYGAGPELPIRLVRVKGQWSVDQLTLGSS